MTVYTLACLLAIKPKVLLTFIDNDIRFHLLARLYDGIFLAIQNGNRWFHNAQAAHFSVPNYFCFGDFDRTLYPQAGRLMRMVPIGSLKWDLAEELYPPAGRVAKVHDLCLISNWIETFPDAITVAIFNAYRVIVGYCGRYVLVDWIGARWL